MTRTVFVCFLLAFCSGDLVGRSETVPTNEMGIQYLGHVALGVTDLDKALRFYRDQLGLTEVFRLNKPSGSPLLVYLRLNNNNFIELFPGAEKQTQAEIGRTGLLHLGFFVKDLQATLRTLRQRGYHLADDAFKQAAQVRADGTFLYFIKDPDGNSIELSQITPDSKQAKSRR
ncbi:MAG: VOC family protein [Acidobacteria bacterium]|nr:VOC family protein [Acidobacteriota bacterium]MCI0718280.1 VOC family protein [Acidobacteriota bacterium]